MRSSQSATASFVVLMVLIQAGQQTARTIFDPVQHQVTEPTEYVTITGRKSWI